MRVISGSLRGRKLQGPKPGDLRVRPTADRAREALFSILQRWPMGGFLDLFSGTGAVALEAWSRGYETVTAVEKSPESLVMIEANLRGTSVQTLRKDVRKLEGNAFRDMAVIFGDPPYEISAQLWLELAPRLCSWLAPGGVLVWETDRKDELPEVPDWGLVDSRRYGGGGFHFFQPRRD